MFHTLIVSQYINRCVELFLLICRSQIIINKEPTKPPVGIGGWVHYNMENSPVKGREVWDVKRLLEVGTQDQEKGVHVVWEILWVPFKAEPQDCHWIRFGKIKCN